MVQSAIEKENDEQICDVWLKHGNHVFQRMVHVTIEGERCNQKGCEVLAGPGHDSISKDPGARALTKTTK